MAKEDDSTKGHLFKPLAYPKNVGRHSPNKVSQVFREAVFLAMEIAGQRIAAQQLRSYKKQLRKAAEAGDLEDVEFLEKEILNAHKWSGLVKVLVTACEQDPLDFVRFVPVRMLPAIHEITGPEGEPLNPKEDAKAKDRKRYESRDTLLEELRNRGIPIVLDQLPERPENMRLVGRGNGDDTDRAD